MLLNKTKKTKIIESVRIADSFFKRLRGLTFANEKMFDFALVFPLERESRLEASIHMLFVFFPIDVLWLDKNKRVVDKHETLKPFVLSAMPKKAAKYIVELPAGKAKGTGVGDELEWQ